MGKYQKASRQLYKSSLMEIARSFQFEGLEKKQKPKPQKPERRKTPVKGGSLRNWIQETKKQAS